MVQIGHGLQVRDEPQLLLVELFQQSLAASSTDSYMDMSVSVKESRSPGGGDIQNLQRPASLPVRQRLLPSHHVNHVGQSTARRFVAAGALSSAHGACSVVAYRWTALS